MHKQPFTDRTICEVISFFSVQLQVEIHENMSYDSKWHQFDTILKMMIPVVRAKPKSHLTSQFGMLQYQVAVFGMFDERLLNRKWLLTRSNIDKEQKIIKQIKSFFFMIGGWKYC